MSNKKAGEIIFYQEKAVAPLKLIAMQSCRELGEKSTDIWSDGRRTATDQSIPSCGAECRALVGDAKGIIRSSIRGDDLYIMVTWQ